MYDKIMEYGDFSKDDIILDAFCGTGSIGLYLAKNVKEVVGIEINEQAVKMAIKNSQINNISNATFIANDMEKEIKKYQGKKNFFDVVVIDPPRSGIYQEFIKILREHKPKKIVYVSCNPDTLVRDLKQLNDIYGINEVTPVDMFSQTYHIEAVVKMTLK